MGISIVGRRQGHDLTVSFAHEAVSEVDWVEHRHDAGGNHRHFAYGWQTRDDGGFLWELLLSVVHGVAALYLLMQPIGALASLTAVLALYLTGKATLEIIASLQHRSVRGSGWLMFDGIFTLILAIMIWYTWPWSSAYAIGTLVGLSLLFSGTARLLRSTAEYTTAPV